MGNANEVWSRRLKEIRTASGLSQKQLGIQAGLDPFAASTRINRYELGIHKADYKVAQLLSKVLDIPTGYLYIEDDQMAELVLIYHRLTVKRRNEVFKFVRSMTS